MKDGCYPECPDRNETCHIDCERYRVQRERNEIEKERRHREIAVFVYQIEQKNKSIKATKSHKTWKRSKRLK
jgi:hypothetical protein